MGKQQRIKIIRAAAFQCWRLISIIVFNGKVSGWRHPLFGTMAFPGTASQKVVVEHLGQLCDYFTRDPLSGQTGLQPEQVMQSKGVDYIGEEILHW